MASNGFKKLMLGMEELGHELKQGDEYFDLLYSYISKEDLDEYRNEPLTEASEVTQYGVHQFSTNSIIFRGSEEECGRYINERPELWDDAEVYFMTPDDPHYLTEAYSNDTVELDYKDLEFTQYGEQLAVDQWDEYEIKTDWTYHVDKDDLYAFILDECLTADEYPAAFTDEFDINNPADWAAYSKWLDSNYSEIYAKYADKILYNFEYAAMLDAQKKYDPEDELDPDSKYDDRALYESYPHFYIKKDCFEDTYKALLNYSLEHPDYFAADNLFDAINELSEQGIIEIPAEYCEDPENCTEEEAETYINDFLFSLGNMAKLKLLYPILKEGMEEKICCICKQPYEGYGNNAEPVCSGTCCDKCNIERVIPMRFKMMKESLNEGNPVSGKIPESLDSFLQDIAQMYQTIDYGDIMDHDYSEDDIKALRSLRRKFREEAQYEGSEEAEAAMNDIAEKVAAILKAKSEALLETDESGNDEIEVNCDGEDCAELITVSVDAEGPHYCCNCAPKYMKQEALTEEKNSEKLFRKFPELRKPPIEEVEEVITEKLSDGTYKITYYLATATRNRRPETREDIDNDYRVDTVHAADDFEAMREAFRIQRELDESDIDFEMEDYDIESVDDFIKYFDDTDWGDGSILMLKVEGPDGVIYDTGYDKDTFIKELDDNIEYQKKMIADMEEIDPATAKAWREVLNMDEAIEPECIDCEEEIIEEVDDDYSFDDMDEMLTEDSEIKRLRHIYGVE